MLINCNKGIVTPSFNKYKNIDILASEKIDERTEKIMQKIQRSGKR